MSNRPIKSREYKLLLNVDRFVDRVAGYNAVLALTEHLLRVIGGEGKDAVEPQNDAEKVRKTSYLDTKDMALSQRSLALRVRRENDGKTQLNLKFRSPDRYLSAANEVLETLPSGVVKTNKNRPIHKKDTTCRTHPSLSRQSPSGGRTRNRRLAQFHRNGVFR